MLPKALKRLLVRQSGLLALLLLRREAVVATELNLVRLRLVLSRAVGSRMVGLAAILVGVPFDGRAGASGCAAIQAGKVFLVLLGRVVHPAGTPTTVLLGRAVVPVLLRRDLIQDGELDVVQHLLLIRHGQPLYDVGQHALARRLCCLEATASALAAIEVALLSESWTRGGPIIDLDEAGDHFVGNVLGRCVQHLLQLLGREALDDDVLLLFAELVLLLELFELGLLSLAASAESAALPIEQALELLVVEALQQTLPPLLHFDQPALQPLPELVVVRPSHIGAVPDGVLDELLDLVDPLCLQHALLDGLDGDHQAGDVLDEDVVASDQQLVLLDVASLSLRDASGATLHRSVRADLPSRSRLTMLTFASQRCDRAWLLLHRASGLLRLLALVECW